MTANVFEIKRFAVHDGDGIRTTVFFKGCPLRCVWCHNPEGLTSRPQLAYYPLKCIGCGECASVCGTGAHTFLGERHIFEPQGCIACGECAAVCLTDALTLYGKEMTLEELLPLLLEDREFYENSGGGVTLSGGECLLQADFCAELLKRLKAHGIHTAIDTCGYVPREAFDKVIPYTDLFLYDIKAYGEDTHIACTGSSNRQILSNLAYLDRCGTDIEIRIPYVPDLNAGEIEGIAGFLSVLGHITGVRLLPYHNYAGSKYAALGMKNTSPDRLPTDDEMAAAREIMERISGVSVLI